MKLPFVRRNKMIQTLYATELRLIERLEVRLKPQPELLDQMTELIHAEFKAAIKQL